MSTAYSYTEELSMHSVLTEIYSLFEERGLNKKEVEELINSLLGNDDVEQLTLF